MGFSSQALSHGQAPCANPGMVQIMVTVGGDCFSFVVTPSGVSSYALTGTLRTINRSGTCNPDLNHARILCRKPT